MVPVGPLGPWSLVQSAQTYGYGIVILLLSNSYRSRSALLLSKIYKAKSSYLWSSFAAEISGSSSRELTTEKAVLALVLATANLGPTLGPYSPTFVS